ncbi:hypothetical protein EXW96_26665 [Paenibacillus sp. JMULE4]|uniref:DUF960 family protein n=1 Tax=Paenibacillus sp. JMULE4 TaxID=2518342 RepID=UPI0015772F1C|nr:DUF960 family protein [Paenibacillus sp. JMULE4]NTZ20974.1 hypothetical protein [Paenibacillus sp. JMULE4]
MFRGTKYITQGINAEIPAFLQNILWYMIETMEVSEKDYLQIFQLNQASERGVIRQRIIHTQEQPPFQKEYIIHTKQIVTAKIYVIDDKTHCTMLLADEY